MVPLSQLNALGGNPFNQPPLSQNTASGFYEGTNAGNMQFGSQNPNLQLHSGVGPHILQGGGQGGFDMGYNTTQNIGQTPTSDQAPMSPWASMMSGQGLLGGNTAIGQGLSSFGKGGGLLGMAMKGMGHENPSGFISGLAGAISPGAGGALGGLAGAGGIGDALGGLMGGGGGGILSGISSLFGGGGGGQSAPQPEPQAQILNAANAMQGGGFQNRSRGGFY